MDLPDARPASYIQNLLLGSIDGLGFEEFGEGSEVIDLTLSKLDSVVLSVQSSKFSVVLIQLGSWLGTYRQGADVSCFPCEDEGGTYNVLIISSLEGPAVVLSVTDISCSVSTWLTSESGFQLPFCLIESFLI